MQRYNTSIFIFRRDLRITDNIGLQNAILNTKTIIPLFICDPQQTTKKNVYKSERALQFMIESLMDLEDQFEKQKATLYILCGNPIAQLKKLFTSIKIDAVFINHDYTPFSIKRDNDLQKLCLKEKIDFIALHDALIHDPNTIKTAKNQPYTIFTPFFNKAIKQKICPPLPTIHADYYSNKIQATINVQSLFKKFLSNPEKKPRLYGGRSAGLMLLKKVSQLKNYTHDRDYPSIDNTSHLSPHLKFGTLSIREAIYMCHKKLGGNHPIIRQFFWRDFFTYIAFHFPHIFGHNFKKNDNTIQWLTNNKNFKNWCNGTTGFPIIDAGMRELNTTGYINGRIRMLVASFLTKDLHINWLKGELYFATKLIDYDPSVNNGNWQWVASTGSDAQPYFRIFNPWVQQKKYDPDCLYIKKWVPELQNIDAKKIHTWWKSHATIKHDYLPPIVSHAIEQQYTKQLFKKGVKILRLKKITQTP